MLLNSNRKQDREDRKGRYFILNISSFLFCLAEMSSMYETQERGQAGAIDYY